MKQVTLAGHAQCPQSRVYRAVCQHPGTRQRSSPHPAPPLPTNQAQCQERVGCNLCVQNSRLASSKHHKLAGPQRNREVVRSLPHLTLFFKYLDINF